MAVTGTSTIQKPINVMFTERFLERAKYKTHYFAGTDPASVRKHGGSSTALWRRIEHLTPSTTALSELSAETYPTRTAEQPTVTDIQKAVSKYGTHILLTEEADVFNFNGTTAELLDILADYGGRSVNMVVRNEAEDNATLVYQGGVAADDDVTASVTAATLNSVINTLNRNVAESFTAMTVGSTNIGTVPILSGYYGICHPDVAHDVAGLTGFTSVEKYAGQVSVLPGEFGVYGRGGFAIRFMQTPDASIDLGAGATGAAASSLRTSSGDNADLYTIAVYGRHAMGTLGLGNQIPTSVMDVGDAMPPVEIINKDFGSAGAADPLNEYSSLGVKMWAAAQILNGNWIRGIRTAASEIV